MMARVVCNATLPPIVANKDISGGEATLLGGSTEMSNTYLTCVQLNIMNKVSIE